MKFFKAGAGAKAALSAMVLAAAGTAQAQGIPTIDAAHIATSVANQVETIAKWGQQFSQMEQQLTQQAQHYAAITGSRGMGALLDNTGLRAALPSDWTQIVANVKSTAAYATARSQYPTFASLPKTTALYDVIAAQNATMSDLYTKANARAQVVQDLMSQIDLASDPAAKQDLTNRLISEQNAIQANQNLVSVLQAKQKDELAIASQQADAELTCKEFKNC